MKAFMVKCNQINNIFVINGKRVNLILKQQFEAKPGDRVIA